MKTRTFTWAILLSVSPAFAQDVWDMDRCMGYAVEHATEVERQKVEVRQSRTDYRTALLDFLPSIGAQLSGQYSWGRNIDPETNTYNNVTTFNNYWQLSASMPVFDGGRTIAAFRQARAAKGNALNALQKARDEKAIAVMGKFVDATYAEKSVELARQKLDDARQLLKKTRTLYELGEKSWPDVVQIESQVAEDDYNLLHQQNLARQTLLELKREMNFPTDGTLRVDTVINEARPASMDNGEQLFSLYGEQSVDVRAAQGTAENARFNWIMARASLMPSLNLGAAIATNYYKNLSADGFHETFNRQFRNNMGEYFHLTLSIPVFAPSQWRLTKRARANYKLAQIGLEETRRKLHDDILMAVMDRDGYCKEVEQMKRKVEADNMAYLLSTRKYEEGLLSVFDLQTVAQTLMESRIKLLQLQLMLTMKQKLVEYYKGEPLWTLK